MEFGSLRLPGLAALMVVLAAPLSSAQSGSSAITGIVLRPELMGPSLSPKERTLSHWFNTSAFADTAPFTFGNSPRSVLRGPAVVTTDVTLEKTIGLVGDTRFDMRGLRHTTCSTAQISTFLDSRWERRTSGRFRALARRAPFSWALD